MNPRYMKPDNLCYVGLYTKNNSTKDNMLYNAIVLNSDKTKYWHVTYTDITTYNFKVHSGCYGHNADNEYINDLKILTLNQFKWWLEHGTEEL